MTATMHATLGDMDWLFSVLLVLSLSPFLIWPLAWGWWFARRGRFSLQAVLILITGWAILFGIYTAIDRHNRVPSDDASGGSKSPKSGQV